MNDSMTIAAYALITILGAAALWFALAWHDEKIECEEWIGRLLEARADAEAANLYVKRALEAEGKLRLVDEYGNDQYDNAQDRKAHDVCLYQTFDQWLKEREEVNA